jgi:hypothetical protein
MLPEWAQVALGFISVVALIAGMVRLSLNFFIREMRDNIKDSKTREKDKDDKIEALSTRLDLVEAENVTTKAERDEFKRKLVSTSRRLRKAEEDVRTTNTLIHDIRRTHDKERATDRAAVDLANEKREAAEKLAAGLQADVKLLKEQRTSLETRLNDRERAHKAEIKAVETRAEKIEAEHKLLITTMELRIKEAVEKVTQPLREELERLRLGINQSERREDEGDAKQVENVGSGTGVLVAAGDAAGDVGAGAGGDRGGVSGGSG